MKKKILSSIIILLILSIGLVSQVNAASSTTVKTEESKIKQISLVNSPTISFDIDKEKLADVKINVKDSKKISEVKIYEIPNKNKSKKEDITNKLTPKKISDKEYVYTMSHKNFLKSENKYFIIEAINESKSSLYMEFTLKKVTNAETKKTYYGLNRAPIISQIKIENDKLVFRTIEYFGMRNVLVKDLNNKNNEVLKKENVNKGVTEYSIPLSNLTKTKEGMYTIRIDGTEADQDGYARVSRRRISFKVVEKVGKVPAEEVVNPKMNKTNVTLRKNQTTILSVSGVKSKAVSWKSSDESVASILLKAETQAKITAKKAGKATITVKVGDKELKSTITVQDSFINSPTISFENDKEKLADVKMHVKDANAISTVKIYNITTNNNKKTRTEITDKFTPNKVSENEYVYTFSDKNFLKEGKVYLAVVATNKKGCYINMEFTVSKVTNAETKKIYYGINRAPSMTNIKLGKTKLSFRAVEFWGMEKFELQDVNNNNNVVFKRENLRKGSTDYTIKLADIDLKEGADGMYKIKMIAKEAARNGESKAIYRTIKFRKALKDTPAPTEDVKPKLDKSTVVLEGKTFELLTVSDTGSKAISWKAEDDNIVDVVLRKNNIARLRAKKAGKTTVIARVGSEEIKCKIYVPEISPDKISIMKGSNITLKLNNIDTKKTVTYKSSNEKIATVDKNGKVEAKSVGSVKIIATYEGKEFISKVTVIDPKLNNTSLVLMVNKTRTLKMTGIANKAVTYKSSNEKIATVDKNGKIEAKNPGMTIITATNDKKEYKCKVTVIKAAKTNGYYYTTSRGYRIYYKKTGKIYKRLNGTTDYTASEDSKIYAGTNEILKAIGYDSKNYDFRVLIVADKDLKNCTLTVLAKDESGNYSIPVKTSLCVVPESAKNLKEKLITGSADITKIAGQSKNVDVEKSQNRQARQSDWFKYGDKILAPGTMSTSGGFYQSLFYNSKTSKKVLNDNCYTEMGTAASSGSIRLYWQDLKWLYEHCQQDTVGRMIRSTKAFTPFGECTKIDPKTNTSQEKPDYKLTSPVEKTNPGTGNTNPGTGNTNPGNGSTQPTQCSHSYGKTITDTSEQGITRSYRECSKCGYQQTLSVTQESALCKKHVLKKVTIIDNDMNVKNEYYKCENCKYYKLISTSKLNDGGVQCKHKNYRIIKVPRNANETEEYRECTLCGKRELVNSSKACKTHTWGANHEKNSSDGIYRIQYNICTVCGEETVTNMKQIKCKGKLHLGIPEKFENTKNCIKNTGWRCPTCKKVLSSSSEPAHEPEIKTGVTANCLVYDKAICKKCHKTLGERNYHKNEYDHEEGNWQSKVEVINGICIRTVYRKCNRCGKTVEIKECKEYHQRYKITDDYVGCNQHQYRTCTKCGKKLKDLGVTGKTNHDWHQTDDTKKRDGLWVYYYKTKKCSKCAKTETDNNPYKSQIECSHSYTLSYKYQDFIRHKMIKVYKCKVCGNKETKEFDL